MKHSKNILIYVIASILIITGSVFWYEYEDSKQITDEMQIQNEEWAIQKKYPWRARKLDSASDLQMCKTLIYNSDLTDEEKKQEEAELIRKYQSQQNN
ncbi:MAG: hypothetical protein ACLUGY_01685 [Phocaeicola massiliensis]|jgi:hypothetical protein